MKIAVLINIVAPYTTPVFTEIANRPGVDLLVIYESLTESNRAWTPDVEVPYQHTVLSGWTLDLRRFTHDAYLHVPSRPLRAIHAFAPDVVVAAGAGIWSSPVNVAAFFQRRGRWSFVPWWGSFRRQRPSIPRRLASPWVRHFVRSSDAWLAYGSRARADVIALGADPSRTFVSPTVSKPLFPIPRTRPPHEPHRHLFVGQLIERKGLRSLLAAFACSDTEAELWIAGSGEQTAVVADAAARDRRIRFLGHVPLEEMSRLYASVDSLILPSAYEVWGLVVNEALEAGLPVVASDAVGAVDDLIISGVNGIVFPSGDEVALRTAMAAIRGWTAERLEAGRELSAAKLANWSIAAAADGVVHAAHAARVR